MERPAKRQRILEPNIRSQGEPGSQMIEDSFSLNVALQNDKTEYAVPTRTISLSDFRRPALRRPSLQRRNAGVYLIPRAPDATVTANAVQINVDDGTGTSTALTVAVTAGETVVSLPDVSVAVTVPGISSETNAVGSITTDSQSVITTPPPSPLPSDSSASLNPLGTGLSEALNSTTSATATSEHTVTVTAISTLQIAVQNGTVIVTQPQSTTMQTLTSGAQSSITGSSSVTSGSSIPTGIGESTESSSSERSLYSSSVVDASVTAGTSSTSSSAAPATSSSSSAGGGGGGGGAALSPTQQQVVGGVVGGVAGVAVVLLVLLVILRWYRRRLKARGELPEQIAERQLQIGGGPVGGGPRHAHTMSERSSGVPLVATLRSGLHKWRPSSAYTQGTTGTGASIPDESARGFQRIAGRKIAPVLGTGGDPYGGNYGAFEKDTAAGPSDPLRHNRNERSLAGSSFYRDSGGFYGGRGGANSPTYPPSPTIGTAVSTDPSTGVRDLAGVEEEDNIHPSQISLPISRPEGMAALRPSPARTPVTVSPASSIKLPIQQAPPTMEGAPPVPPIAPGLQVPRQRSADGIGRSMPSRDGSKVSMGARSGRSRFSESLG